jgi:hypothetical protein
MTETQIALTSKRLKTPHAAAIAAALAGGLLSSYAVETNKLIDSGVFAYSRAVIYQTTNVYAVRMAGVFMISLGTIWMRTGLMHRGWAIVTYALALVLLVSVGYSLWVTLIFPGWVLVVSVFILIRSLQEHRLGVTGETDNP